MTRHKHAVVSYMGPLLVLVSLALRHRNTIIERMNTTRATATAEIINMRRPSLVSYQWASSVGQTWRKTCITQNAKSAKLFTFCLQAKLLKATLCLWWKRLYSSQFKLLQPYTQHWSSRSLLVTICKNWLIIPVMCTISQFNCNVWKKRGIFLNPAFRAVDKVNTEKLRLCVSEATTNTCCVCSHIYSFLMLRGFFLSAEALQVCTGNVCLGFV